MVHLDQLDIDGTVRNGQLKEFQCLHVTHIHKRGRITYCTWETTRTKSVGRLPFVGHFAGIMCVVEGEGGGGVQFDCTWLPSFKF